jgi:hypothetical protein
MSSKSKTIRDLVTKYVGEEVAPSAAQTVGNTGGALTNPTDAYALQKYNLKNKFTSILRRKKPQ